MVFVVFGKDVFELLGLVATLIVVGTGIGSVLRFVDGIVVDSEKWIRKNAGTGEVGETAMDDCRGDRTEK